MSLIKVYSGNVETGKENLTEIINGCVGFYILAPDITDEIEIDFYLQFELGEVQRNKRVRLEADITLVDTLTMILIPEELRNVESNNLKLLFLTDISIFLEIWIINPDRYDGKEDLEEIKQQLGIIADHALIMSRKAKEIEFNVLMELPSFMLDSGRLNEFYLYQ